MGIFGALRKMELKNITVADIEDCPGGIAIKIPDTKTKRPREFLITRSLFRGINMFKLIHKYRNLRPSKTNHSRFFVGYRQGKCTVQPVGQNTFSGMPKIIAEFLRLPSPNRYTGHCFRRTSASFLADSGVDVSVLQRHGGWKSRATAEGYVETSRQNKRFIAEAIMQGPSTSAIHNMPTDITDSDDIEALPIRLNNNSNYNTVVQSKTSERELQHVIDSNEHQPITLNNCSHFTINIIKN